MFDFEEKVCKLLILLSVDFCEKVCYSVCVK